MAVGGLDRPFLDGIEMDTAREEKELH